MGAVGLPNKTTVSPLKTEDTLAKPDLGKMMGVAVLGVAMMDQLRNRTREREKRRESLGRRLLM